MKFTPTQELLDLPEDERIQWAEWLESGKWKQHQGSWNSGLGEPDALCCLSVLAVEKHNKGKFLRSGCWGNTEIKSVTRCKIGSRSAIDIYAAQCANARFGFALLNDRYKLNFPQIAQLLRGNTVEKQDE